MNPLVTVAIAAYNVEKFLIDGVNCVLNQTFKNIEIILVDDGSTDDTSKMCDEIAQKDKRVRVFHKENGGLGSARNVGIDNAQGEFLYFFDVDDTIDSNLIEENVKMAQEHNADLVMFGYYARYSSKQKEEAILLKEHIINSNDELKKVYSEELLWLKHGNGFAWNKFYRMSFLKKNDFHFGNQKIQQDEPFNMQLYRVLENVYISPNAYYHYVIYSSGNAGTRYIPNKADIIIDVYHCFMEFYDGWKINDERVLKYIENRFINGLFSVICINFFHEKCDFTFEEKQKRINEIFEKQELIQVLKNTQIQYSKNPINYIQQWAFNNRRTNLIIRATELKNKINNILLRG